MKSVKAIMTLFLAACLYSEQWLLDGLLYSTARPRMITGALS